SLAGRDAASGTSDGTPCASGSSVLRARFAALPRRFPPEPMAVRTHDDVSLVRRGAGRQVVFSSRTTFSEEPVELFADLLVGTAERVRVVDARRLFVDAGAAVDRVGHRPHVRTGVQLVIARVSRQDCRRLERWAGSTRAAAAV